MRKLHGKKISVFHSFIASSVFNFKHTVSLENQFCVSWFKDT